MATIIAVAWLVQWVSRDRIGLANVVRVLILLEVATVVVLGARVVLAQKPAELGGRLPIHIVLDLLLVEVAIGHVMRWGRPPDFHLGYNLAIATLAVWAMMTLGRYERRRRLNA